MHAIATHRTIQKSQKLLFVIWNESDTRWHSVSQPRRSSCPHKQAHACPHSVGKQVLLQDPPMLEPGDLFVRRILLTGIWSTKGRSRLLWAPSLSRAFLKWKRLPKNASSQTASDLRSIAFPISFRLFIFHFCSVRCDAA